MSKVSLGRNYDTPKSLVRGLLNLVTQNVSPYEGCFCRECRLIRKAAKFSGIKDLHQYPQLSEPTSSDRGVCSR